MTISFTDKSVRTLQILKVIAGTILLILPALLMPWIWLVILAVFSILLVSEGVEIDTEKRQYRRYKQFIKRRGEWKDLDNFSKVVIKPYKGRRHIYNLNFAVNAGFGSTFQDYNEFVQDIYLMSPNHGRKLFINTCKNKAKALALAKELALHTGFEIEKFKIRPSG